MTEHASEIVEALRYRIPVGQTRHLTAWWFICAGYDLGMAWLLAIYGRWGWALFHVVIAAWMLCPLRQPVTYSGRHLADDQ